MAEAAIITLLVFILGCVVHLERKTSSMDTKVSFLWKLAVNGKKCPRPRRSRSRGLDKKKSGG
jgi:hypothetical protein